jgi:hypothetical protein
VQLSDVQEKARVFGSDGNPSSVNVHPWFSFLITGLLDIPGSAMQRLLVF